MVKNSLFVKGAFDCPEAGEVMRDDDVDDKPDYNSPPIGAVDWRRTGNGWDGHWRFYSVMGVGDGQGWTGLEIDGLFFIANNILGQLVLVITFLLLHKISISVLFDVSN